MVVVENVRFTYSNITHFTITTNQIVTQEVTVQCNGNEYLLSLFFFPTTACWTHSSTHPSHQSLFCLSFFLFCILSLILLLLSSVFYMQCYYFYKPFALCIFISFFLFFMLLPFQISFSLENGCGNVLLN